MRINKIIFLCIITILLGGCFNYKEINDYAIVSGISIDKCEKDKYEVGIQIMNSKKDKESDNSLITFYKAKGDTIYEALEQIMLDSPKELYLGHNEVLIISEELLKEKNPLEYLDYFMRDSEVEKDSLMIISKDEKASNILKIITPLETIPSKNLKSTLAIADNFSGAIILTSADEFISELKKTGSEAILPSVIIKGKIKDGKKMDNISQSDPKTKLVFSTLGYFENNKLKGYLNKNESMGYNILSNNVKEAYINLRCDNNNYATLRIDDLKTSKKTYFKNNKPYVKITVKINANLLEYNCKGDILNNKELVNNIEKKANKKVKTLLEETHNKLYIQNKSDGLGYGNYFMKYKKRDMIKNNYNEKNILKDLNFIYDIKVNIKSSELSIKSIEEKNKYE